MKPAVNIFLIEDDESDTYFFIEALKEIENAILCDIACNGNEALEKLQSLVVLPDIIFSDIHMPQMDGIACFTEMKRSPKLCNIPVVFLSSDIAKVDTVRRIGASAFIKKPNDGQHLKEQIEKLLHLDFKADGRVAYYTFDTALLA